MEGCRQKTRKASTAERSQVLAFIRLISVDRAGIAPATLGFSVHRQHPYSTA
jgi:hypothetical protein